MRPRKAYIYTEHGNVPRDDAGILTANADRADELGRGSGGITTAWRNEILVAAQVPTRDSHYSLPVAERASPRQAGTRTSRLGSKLAQLELPVT